MAYIYILIGTLLVIFLESFFVALCNFRIFYLVILLLFKRINWKYLLIFVFLTSIISDVVYHYVFGATLLITMIPLLLVIGGSFLISVNNMLPGYVIKFLSIILYYLLLHWVPSLLSNGLFISITLSGVGIIVLKSFITLGICFVFDILMDRVRKREENGKLRLV